MSDDKRNLPTTVGVALEKARHRVGYSEDAAAMAIGISNRELAQIESGLRVPKPDVLKAMSKFYGVDPMRFGSGRWVPRVPPRYDEEAGIIWLGYMSITFSKTLHDNEYLFRSVSGAIRTMRNLDGQLPVFIRSLDLGVLAELIDFSDPELPQIMGHHLNQDAAHVEWLLEQLQEQQPELAS